MTAWLAMLASGALGAELSAQQQALLLLKVLPYDRNLATRCPSTVTVAILHTTHGRNQAKLIEDAIQTLTAAGALVNQRPVQVVTLSYESRDQLAAELDGREVGVLYLAVRLDSLVDLLALTHDHDVLTVTPDAPEVKAGVSLGLVTRADKATILINLEGARSEGVDFPANFLSMAEVVR